MIQCHYDIIEIKKIIHTTGHDSPENAFQKKHVEKELLFKTNYKR